ncbi:hypothetical protein RhiirA1_442367 [Rhizophagus irregularis]|uniref:Uncharacterized protein n=1 Tax=Rhizophagus irregularis TaxID=588596 RepID=A0A2N0RPV5_9GLOM|nr:hypothetical protein RhiirA1_442367 [Rhizophagus irregularis]
MKLKHFLIFLSIITLVTLPIKSNVITFTEKETTEFQVADILKYGDNTIVLQIVRNLSGGNCFETKISFRVIYPNGTIIPIDLSMEELEIQSFNFCTVDGFNPITLKAIETKKGNFIIVTYTVAADVNNPLTYNDYLMLIDLNGKIYRNEDGIFSNIAAMVLTLQMRPAIVSTVDGGGSVFDVKHVDATPPTSIGINELTDPQFIITPLPFGGYFYSVVQTTNMSSDIWGYVLDENGNFNRWNLSYPTLSDSNASPQLLTNNTLVMLQPIVGQNWSLIATDLYKIHEDNGYDNMFIRNTSPTIHQTITARETNPLKITYTIPIGLSNGTITIFQSNGSSNPGIVRQTINGLNNQNYVTLDNDTVRIDIIESTFNNPGSTYYVMIENNFVSSLLYNEPIPGLSSNIWSFTTLPEEKKEKVGSKIKMFFDGIYGKVRLTKNGTSYFDTLNPNQKNKFFDNLTQELADAVAVTSKRITTNYRFVIDTESSSKQYLLSIKIDKPQSASDRETKLITKDLDAMIQNMDITVLESGSSSKYLDPLYGYVTIRNYSFFNFFR